MSNWIAMAATIVAVGAALGAGYLFGRGHNEANRANIGRGRLTLVLVVIALGLALSLNWPASTSSQTADAASDESQQTDSEDAGNDPVVPVVTAQAVEQDISQSVTAYGSIVAAPAAANTISVPYEATVTKVFVAPGEQVSAGAALVHIAPSPDTRLEVTQAANELQAARRNLQQTQQRYDEHLATATELSDAQQVSDSAQAKLESMQQRGAADEHDLTAPAAGLVMEVDAEPDSVMAPGSTLVKLLASHLIEVKLGIDPTTAARLKIGQAVEVCSVHDESANAVPGSIRLVSRQVDADTRLVAVYVALDTSDGLRLNDFVKAKLTTDQRLALVVPRASVLPDGQGQVLFTVEDGRAVAHQVATGMESDKAIELASGDVRAGDVVVVAGNAELSDGMAVQQEAKP